MKVSVIIPCYKIKDKWLKRLMDSLSNQTIGMDNLEIIFVIDASPDDTFEKIFEYEKIYPENILIINSEEKIGPGGARTLGLSYANGEYVAFLDQDDCVEYCMYEHMYEKAKLYDTDMVESYSRRDKGELTGAIKTGKEDKYVRFDSAEDRKRFFREDEPDRRLYWAKIYRREFLISENITFPYNLKYDDNYFKGVTFYTCKSIYVLEEYLHHWVINPESISMTDNQDFHSDRMEVELLKIDEYIKRNLFSVYKEEMEYIFLIQFYQNTLNTIITRSGSINFSLFLTMRNTIKTIFPQFNENPYLLIRKPACIMRGWVEKVRKKVDAKNKGKLTISDEVYEKIKKMSFLDLISCDTLTEDEFLWYCRMFLLSLMK